MNSSNGNHKLSSDCLNRRTLSLSAPPTELYKNKGIVSFAPTSLARWSIGQQNLCFGLHAKCLFMEAEADCCLAARYTWHFSLFSEKHYFKKMSHWTEIRDLFGMWLVQRTFRLLFKKLHQQGQEEKVNLSFKNILLDRKELGFRENFNQVVRTVKMTNDSQASLGQRCLSKIIGLYCLPHLQKPCTPKQITTTPNYISCNCWMSLFMTDITSLEEKSWLLVSLYSKQDQACPGPRQGPIIADHSWTSAGDGWIVITEREVDGLE